MYAKIQLVFVWINVSREFFNSSSNAALVQSQSIFNLSICFSLYVLYVNGLLFFSEDNRSEKHAFMLIIVQNHIISWEIPQAQPFG